MSIIFRRILLNDVVLLLEVSIFYAYIIYYILGAYIRMIALDGRIFNNNIFYKRDIRSIEIIIIIIVVSVVVVVVVPLECARCARDAYDFTLL